MKKIKVYLLPLFFILILPFVSFSQGSNPTLKSLLDRYYEIENALVKSDVAGAAKGASEFSIQLKALDAKSLTVTQQNVLRTLQSKLFADAGSISSSKDLVKQRTSFQTFSENVIALIRTVKPTKPAYVVYCPMKKSYWLSAASEVKNPYYGSSMLTCGKVTETIE